MPVEPPAPVEEAWIAAHVPHKGRMRLIHEVLHHDTLHIRCVSRGIKDADHPLRAHGRLGAACGVEIAAQAMAVHAALLAPHDGAAPRFGALVSVRGLRFHALRLDDVAEALICDARRMAADAGTAVYEFELIAESTVLLSGRAAVVLDAEGIFR